MKKSILGALGAGVFFVALFVPASMNEAFAEIDVNINIGPPPISIAEPPAVAMIPNSTIYFVPRIEHDLFFYDNYWWAPRGSQWYRSSAFNGPWKIIENHYVPAPVFQVPKDYRHRYEKQPHIPYGQWKKQWSDRGKKGRGERKEDKKGDKQSKQDRGHGKKGD
ncbi:MAG: hypothetical protein SCH71_12370 [Desulfobulbaceae bacterium]|nr:hypothetical protein [Desulfobulbaceae bacterium]